MPVYNDGATRKAVGIIMDVPGGLAIGDQAEVEGTTVFVWPSAVPITGTRDKGPSESHVVL
jgi:hypothetical protein